MIPVRTIQEGPQFPPGSTSYEVELLQRALVRAGFDPGPVDGNFLPGSLTASAVRGFQAANGLAAVGLRGRSRGGASAMLAENGILYWTH